MANTCTTAFPDNITTLDPSGDVVIASYWGYISATVAVIFLGLIVVPVKRYETGDGIFFQLMFCHGALLVGLVVQMIRSQAVFYPIVMTGGVVWITANIFLVPIVKAVGMAQGMCVWGICNMLSGWATGRFGLFGIQTEVPDSQGLNYGGVVLCALSAIIFSFLKPELRNGQRKGIDDSVRSSLYGTYDSTTNIPNINSTDSENTLLLTPKTHDCTIFVDRLPPTKKKIVGITMCVISGILYGQTYTPSIYVQQQYPHASQFGMDYAFATMCGLFLSNTVYFVIYCLIRGNLPRIYPSASLPGIVTGLMWGTGSALWYLVNDTLSESVSFPIMTTVPMVINALVGVVFFREVKGRRNLCFLTLGIIVTTTGTLMCVFSKHPR